MRGEFVRFLRLAYLLDFIAIQSLGKVYVSSAEDFLEKIRTVTECYEVNKTLDYNMREEE